MPKFSEISFNELLLHLTFLPEFSAEWLPFCIQESPYFLEISSLEICVQFFLTLKSSGYVIISGVQKWDLKRVICEIVWLLFIYSTFSNSLEIHQVKTKKITTVREVWIPGLN